MYNGLEPRELDEVGCGQAGLVLYLQDKVRGIVQVSVLRGPNGPSFSGSLRGVRTSGTPGDGGPGGVSGKKEPSGAGRWV